MKVENEDNKVQESLSDYNDADDNYDDNWNDEVSEREGSDNEIEHELAKRYYFQEGKIRQKLRRDHEVTLALEVLNDQSRYHSLLQ